MPAAFKLALIVGLFCLALMVGLGCASAGGGGVTPAAVQADVDLAAGLASDYVTLFTPPGPGQTRLLAEIELARRAGDLAAIAAARASAPPPAAAGGP